MYCEPSEIRVFIAGLKGSHMGFHKPAGDFMGGDDVTWGETQPGYCRRFLKKVLVHPNGNTMRRNQATQVFWLDSIKLQVSCPPRN